MKRLFLLIILVTTVAFVHGQTQHFSFLGVKLDGNTADVFNQLTKKGFVPSETEDLALEGNFLELRDVTVKLENDEQTKRVYGLKLTVPAPDSEVFNRMNAYLRDYLKNEFKAEELPVYSNEYRICFPWRCNRNGAEGIFVMCVLPWQRKDEKSIELFVYDKVNYVKMVYDGFIHVPFMDIPINGTTAEFKSKLIAKGLRFLGNQVENGDIGEDDRYYMSFNGSFYGYKNSTVNVFYHKTNNRIYSVEVEVPRNEESTKTVKNNLYFGINKAFEKYKDPPLELIMEVNDQNKGVMKCRVFQPGSYKYAQPVVGYIDIMADLEKRIVHITYTDISSKERAF